MKKKSYKNPSPKQACCSCSCQHTTHPPTHISFMIFSTWRGSRPPRRSLHDVLQEYGNPYETWIWNLLQNGGIRGSCCCQGYLQYGANTLEDCISFESSSFPGLISNKLKGIKRQEVLHFESWIGQWDNVDLQNHH